MFGKGTDNFVLNYDIHKIFKIAKIKNAIIIQNTVQHCRDAMHCASTKIVNPLYSTFNLTLPVCDTNSGA